MNETHIAAAAEEVNCARQELAKAREELDSFEADPQPPSYFEGNAQGYFTFLIEHVKERELALIELSKLDIQKSEKGNKRARPGSNQSGQLTQTSFRQRVASRDKVCAISKMDLKYCEAAHIIAKCNFSVNDTQAKKLWDQRFPGCCENPEHRVMDVRNGILLAKWIHDAFDNFELTIRKEGAIYKAEPQLLVGSSDLHSYNGKIIQFDSDKKHEWPREEFLSFHNECFDDRKVFLEAAAEEYASDDEYSHETIAERAESEEKARNWLTGI